MNQSKIVKLCYLAMVVAILAGCYVLQYPNNAIVRSSGFNSTCAVRNAIPFIEGYPDAPGVGVKGYWKQAAKTLAGIVYLPSLIDVKLYKRRVFLDVGARDYNSSIGSWFMKSYLSLCFANGMILEGCTGDTSIPHPSTQEREQLFEIYAFEIDTDYNPTYENHPEVLLDNRAVWTSDTQIQLLWTDMLSIGRTTGNEKGSRSVPKRTKLAPKQARYRDVQAFNFSRWMIEHLRPDDFVVMKMDIEGAEHDIIPQVLKTGAGLLLDEVFMECHYSIHSGTTFSDCLKMIADLRRSDIFAHYWF